MLFIVAWQLLYCWFGCCEVFLFVFWHEFCLKKCLRVKESEQSVKSNWQRNQFLNVSHVSNLIPGRSSVTAPSMTTISLCGSTVAVQWRQEIKSSSCNESYCIWDEIQLPRLKLMMSLMRTLQHLWSTPSGELRFALHF